MLQQPSSYNSELSCNLNLKSGCSSGRLHSKFRKISYAVKTGGCSTALLEQECIRFELNIPAVAQDWSDYKGLYLCLKDSIFTCVFPLAKCCSAGVLIFIESEEWPRVSTIPFFFLISCYGHGLLYYTRRGTIILLCMEHYTAISAARSLYPGCGVEQQLSAFLVPLMQRW